MDLKECCGRMGADYEELIRRFGSEDRIVRFFRMFLKDDSFSQLEKGLEETDYMTAFRAAHTLKGVCLNLGLGCLQKSSSQLTEVLRDGIVKEDPEPLIKQVRADYQTTMNAIAGLDFPDSN